MDGNVPVPGLNAHRHPQDPLRPPNYLFSKVKKCKRDLKGSVLQEITDRDHFKEAMAEMVLLCTEAMRRSSSSRCKSKPLSLEYIADRLDVDDPCFGYLVRSKEGMLQGFITVTTFTNWQKSFRWDSQHELAFYYDDSDSEDEDVRHQPRKERRVDRDGSLARELQQTVRLGDPYNEGIVWPRIAEITLLGALGCGRTLVSLIIEQLEFQKASAKSNYDYIALQATDNSIPFYESLGFVRVGAVTMQATPNPSDEPTRAESPLSTSSEESAVRAEPLEPSSPEKPDALARLPEIVSSPLLIHDVKRAGETPFDIAKRYKVDVWDIIFLNSDVYKEITPRSRLMKGTLLHVPARQQSDISNDQKSPTKFFVAKENDTPRKIAKKFGIGCNALVAANRNRLPEIQAASRLKEGTRIKVSNLDQHDDVCNPYCHWSFPDDTAVDGGEPSYMMVYKLDRKSARCSRDVRDSLVVPITSYSPPQCLLPGPPKQKETVIVKYPKRLKHPKNLKPPKPPQGPLLARDIFKEQQRDFDPALWQKNAKTEEVLNERWRKLSDGKKARYAAVAVEAKKHYDRAYEEYEVEYSLWEEECSTGVRKTVVEKDVSLFNKVVKLRNDALEGQDYAYWFVLTYIPDLKWCHLAPMVQDGIFGPERKKSSGRPKWRLVDESLGKELDISSMYCIPLKSKAMRRTADADKEEWDILDFAPGVKSRDIPVDLVTPTARPIKKQPVRARSAIKPMSGKIAVIKPIEAAPANQEKQENIAPSPVRPTRGTPRRTPTKRESIAPSPVRPTRGTPRRTSPLWSPPRKRSTPSRVSPRWTPTKQHGTNDLEPARKARRLNNSGGRRSVLQS